MATDDAITFTCNRCGAKGDPPECVHFQQVWSVERISEVHKALVTDDAITEARRLLEECLEDTWAGHRDIHGVDYNECETAPCQWCVDSAKAWAIVEPALSASGAAEARVTALEQENDTLQVHLTFIEGQLGKAEARATAAEEQAQEWEERYDKENDRAFGAEAERDALQAQLTAVRAYMQHTDHCASVVWQGNGWRTPTPTGQACTCGLDAALPPTPEAT